MENKKTNYNIISSNFSDVSEVSYNWNESIMSYKQWIYWGEDNLFPNKILELFSKSGMHASIVKRKTDILSGKGWVVTPSNKQFIDNLSGTEDLNDVVQKCSYDINLFGITYLNVIWNADNTYISQIEHVPADKVRVSKPKMGNEFVYYVSKDWRNVTRPENKPVPIAPFNQNDKENKSQLLAIKEYVPGCDYYSVPDYFSGIKWIDLDVQIAIYHINNVKNGFSPSVVITYKEGIPTDEEQRLLYQNIKKSFSGAKNAGEVILTFSETPESAPTITPLSSNDSDGRYKELMDIVLQEIMSTHRLTAPELAGISTPGKLSTGSETVEAELRFQESVIEPKVKIIERAFSKLSKINNLEPMNLIPVITKENINPDSETEVTINK